MIKIKLCNINDLRIGERRKFKLNDNEILLIRLKDGFYVMENRCPHAGCRLSYYGKIFEDGRIVCTCHGAIFSLKDGRALDGPTQKPLKLYRVKIVEDQVFLET
ncbi:MAG: Rieske (2Fe-2S) protein [Candidatus Methanomethyliaceae archaeon]|nr:Rieske (2Fe-2S) protein [Candidatus Methanomethyliaceae archaeon]MDW7970754.1 Rieske (2Fe-2S) protein [Nitrososphaerota archaeon]